MDGGVLEGAGALPAAEDGPLSADPDPHAVPDAQTLGHLNVQAQFLDLAQVAANVSPLLRSSLPRARASLSRTLVAGRYCLRNS